MTREAIDQLVFGYDEGHRLLGGSTEIPSTVLSVLLGATDAPIGGSRDRLVTGFPLEAIARYALCFTWNAPERPRPGAVWSHVLLVEFEHFESPGAIGSLRNLACRPELRGLEHYDTQLRFQSGHATVGAVPRSLLEAIVTAVYGGGGPVVVHGDLAEAERALFTIWEAQWPELRSRFEFRTRESARVSFGGGVVVARRVRGLTRHDKSPQRKAWMVALTDSIVTQEAPLHRFLGRFGPCDVPETSTVGWLTRLYRQVESGDCGGVRDALENRYSGRREGRELKEQLFGRSEGSWWTVSEVDRLRAILQANCDAWDMEGLGLKGRLCDWIQDSGVEPLLQDLGQVGPESVREALLKALLESGKTTDLAPLIRIDPELAARWLVERPLTGREPDAWRGLEHDQVGAVWAVLPSPDLTSVLAAAVAGHAHAAIEALGLSTALCSAARAKDFAAANSLLEASTWTNAVKVAEEDTEVALLLGAISGGGDVPGLIGALEVRRDDVDETWLKAAAGAISRPKMPAGEVLEVVFGPLHHAMTDNRVPSECWDFLNRVLPEAPDPALRLRRFLVRIAKKEGWRQKRFRRALRGAGPYASELYREINDDKLLLGRIRNFIERL